MTRKNIVHLTLLGLLVITSSTQYNINICLPPVQLKLLQYHMSIYKYLMQKTDCIYMYDYFKFMALNPWF